MIKLKYIELEASRIFNWLAPENITSWFLLTDKHDQFWDENVIELRKQIGYLWREEFDNITGHFTQLEQSIKENGIQHPICLVSGPVRDVHMQSELSIDRLPPKYQNDPSQVLCTMTFGGSRVYFAQKFDLKIPCVVYDFKNLFPDAETVTAKRITELFGSNYGTISQPNLPPRIILKKHSHISSGIYNGMTQETKTAQSLATERLLKRIKL